MLNGQLKPGYNIQVGTENNFVIGYDVFPNPTDTRTFIPHLENVQRRLGCKFKFAIADAGYGSEENYDYLEKNEITGIVKYTTYEKETKRSFAKKTFNTENWKYDAEQKAKVKELLSSEEYKTLMKKRSTECETVFGQTKGNLGFRRFYLRGKEKVGTEWGLLMLGYDFRQLIRLINA